MAAVPCIVLVVGWAALNSHALQPGQNGSTSHGVSWKGAAAQAWMPAAYAEGCCLVCFPAQSCWEAALRV